MDDKIVKLTNELSELKKENEELRKNDAAFKMLKEELSEAYILSEVIYNDEQIPENYRIIEVNSKAELLLNIKRDELIGKTVIDIIPNIENKWINLFSNVITTGVPASFESMLSFNGKYYSGRAYSPDKDKLTITFREITEIKISEEHLRDSEDRYRRLVEKLPDIVYMYSDKYGGNYYSPSVKDILGYEQEYLIKNPFLYHDSIHPDDLVDVDKAISDLSDERTFDIEYRIKDANNIWHWFRDRLVRKIEFKDEIVIEGIATDISEFKNLYAALDNEKMQLDALFDALPAFIFTANSNHDILFANHEFLRLFGEPKSRKCYEILYGQDCPCDDCCLNKEFLKHRVCPREEQLKNGRTYLTSDSIYLNDQGESIVIETGIDITEWVITRHRYKQSEEKYYSIFRNAPLGMFRSTPEGKFIEVNPKLAEILGYDSPEDIINNISDIGKDIYIRQNRRQEIVDELISEDGVKHYENVYRRKDGTSIVANLYIKHYKDEFGRTMYLEGMVEDISERVIFEKILEENEKNFRSVIANLPHGVFAHDLHGNFVIVNRISAKNTGYTEDELMKMNVNDIDPTSLTRNDRENIWNKLSTGEFLQIESNHIRKDGSEYPAEITISAIEIKNKRIMLAIAQDITVRKNAEQAIKNSEERFKVLFQQAPLGYQSLDTDGNILVVNEAWCNTLGYSKDEVIGRNFSEFIHRDFQKVFRENFPRFKKVGYILGIEFEMICKDGTEIIVSFNGKAINDNNNNFKQTHCILHNITEEKKVLQRLAESEEKFHRFFIYSNDGIAITDEKGCIEEWNEAMERITGISKENAFGKKIYDVQIGIIDNYKDQPEIVKQIIDSIDNYFITGESKWLGHITETEVKALNGNTKNLQSRVFSFSTNKGYKAASIVRDVTEQKKTEKELMKSKEALQQVLAEKDKFFSIIAHDIKSPLSGFINLSKDLVENYFEMPFNEINEYANSLYQSSNYLHNLLDNLLEWSRLQRDMTKFNQEKINIKEIAEICVRLYHIYAAEKKVKINLNIADNIFALADENMVQTVLRNLLSNALKFSYPKGVVEINAVNTKNSLIEISVTDYGKGISNTVVETIFSLGDKNIETGTDNEKGSGLGLILSKEFVESNGGSLWFDTESGKGTTFYFTLHKA